MNTNNDTKILCFVLDIHALSLPSIKISRAKQKYTTREKEDMTSIRFGGTATNFMLYQQAEKKHKEKMLRKEQEEAQRIHQELQTQRTQQSNMRLSAPIYPYINSNISAPIKFTSATNFMVYEMAKKKQEQEQEEKKQKLELQIMQNANRRLNTYLNPMPYTQTLNLPPRV